MPQCLSVPGPGFPKSSGDVWPGWSVVPEGVPGPVHDPWDREQAAPVIPFKGNWEDGTADIFVAHWRCGLQCGPCSRLLKVGSAAWGGGG